VATFSQWARTRPVRPVTWVCGPEEVLCREVAQHVFSSVPVASRTVLWAPEGWVWDYLLASCPGARCICVQNAESLPQAAVHMPVLLESASPLSQVVLVSAEDDFTRENGELASHLAAIKASKHGQLIRCCRPSKEEDLLKLIASWWPGTGLNHAAKLRAACADDLTAVYQACEKARRAGLPADDHQLRLVTPSLSSDWAQAVLSGDRRRAMEAASSLPVSAQLQALASLSAMLAQMTSYVRLVRNLEPDEIARRGITRYRQRQLAPHAGRYNSGREVSCRLLLARAEDALRSGARGGVLEAVSALW